VGRVNNIFDKKNSNDSLIEILVLKEKISLKFDKNTDINSQKIRILEKIKVLEKKISVLDNKLQNKAFLKNAPSDIIKNDKELLTDLSIEENKLRSIVLSIN